MTRRIALISAMLAAVLASCAADADRPDNSAALEDINRDRGGIEVVVEGMVTRVFAAARDGYASHERFEIRVSSGTAEQDILVADNITVGEAAPVKLGDDVIVKGVLEVDPQGPVIHWTHHDPRLHHVSGFVEVGGKKYE